MCNLQTGLSSQPAKKHIIEILQRWPLRLSVARSNLVSQFEAHFFCNSSSDRHRSNSSRLSATNLLVVLTITLPGERKLLHRTDMTLWRHNSQLRAGIVGSVWSFRIQSLLQWWGSGVLRWRREGLCGTARSEASDASPESTSFSARLVTSLLHPEAQWKLSIFCDCKRWKRVKSLIKQQE